MNQNGQGQDICFRKEERTESWETDLLGRKDAAHQLERLIANAPGPYVIAMTSEWGSGKTFFLKAWGKDLRDRHRPCVYFNAWETDHAGDPLLALTGCIADSLREQGFIEPNYLKKLAESASKIVAQSPGTLAKIVVGVANHYTNGALDEVKDVLSDSVKLGTDLFLKNNARRKNFTKQLEAIAEKASASAVEQAEDPVNGTRHFPLFVMIDELDRCRPSYVIELLENIKHLFSARGVVFLLAIDEEQILSVIQHTFGLCISEKKRDIRHDYLRKFVDVFWRLPHPDTFNLVLTNLKAKKISCPYDWNPKVIENAYDTRCHERRFNLLQSRDDAFYGVLAQISTQFSKSLRECVQVIDRFYIIYTAYNLSWKDSIAILAMLFSTENDGAGLDAMLRSQGIEPAGRQNIESYYYSLSSIVKCLIFVACFGKNMSQKVSPAEPPPHPGIDIFLKSLGVCESQNSPNFGNLCNKVQFVENFYFDDADSTQFQSKNANQR